MANLGHAFRRAQRVLAQQRRQRLQVGLIAALVVVVSVAVLTILMTGDEVGPGSVTTLDLGRLASGSYELYCDIVGHAEAGMVAPRIVAEPASTAAAVP